MATSRKASEAELISLQHEQVVNDAGGARTQHPEVGDQRADQKHRRYGHRDDVAQGLRRHLRAAHRFEGLRTLLVVAVGVLQGC